MGLYSGGLIIGRIFASEIWGAYFSGGLIFFGGGAYYGNFMVIYVSACESIYCEISVTDRETVRLSWKP